MNPELPSYPYPVRPTAATASLRTANLTFAPTAESRTFDLTFVLN
jgi:hypothetical protein